MALAPDVLDTSLELLALAGVPGDEEPVGDPRLGSAVALNNTDGNFFGIYQEPHYAFSGTIFSHSRD